MLVHTGQNFEDSLSEIFFDELELRAPDHYLGRPRRPASASRSARSWPRSRRCFASEHPDRLLILGDTNSGLAAVMAKRLGIPVYHMEAGNRCYDDRVPEEVNRRIIDHCSDVLMPYTERSRENLLREGIAGRAHLRHRQPDLGGDPPLRDQIDAVDDPQRLGLRAKEYFLVTMHRAENVDIEHAAVALLRGAEAAARGTRPARSSVSTHPRTRARLDDLRGLDLPAKHELRFVEPFGFFDFVRPGAQRLLRAVATAAPCRRSAASSRCRTSPSVTSPSARRRSSAAATS